MTTDVVVPRQDIETKEMLVSDIFRLGEVEVGDDAIVVVAPAHTMVPQNGERGSLYKLEEADLVVGPEYGSTQPSSSLWWREEYNSQLRGLAGIRKFDEMRRQDGAVGSSLRAVKAPVRGATWFVQPGEQTSEGKEIADFVARNLNDWMTYPWADVLREGLLMLDFGYYMFEKVWAIKMVDGEPRVYLKKLAARHPLDVVDWHFDSNGGPTSVDLYAAAGSSEHVNIAIDKLCIFTYERECGDLRGRSVLRSAYKHWYYADNAYRIDAIQKERHGIGVPIITLPHGATANDKAIAHEIGRNLRTNESAHVVLPSPAWVIVFAKLEGQPVSALETAEYHSMMIYQNVLAQALWRGTLSSVGTTAEQQMEMFYKSLRTIADDMAMIMNRYVIPQLVDWNWPDITRYPKLIARKLGDTAEARTLSFALRNYAGAGIIQVDEPLEQWARETIDAPMADPDTRREVATPQQAGGARVGPPRQAQAQNQRPAGNSNTGRDGGGTGGGGS